MKDRYFSTCSSAKIRKDAKYLQTRYIICICLPILSFFLFVHRAEWKKNVEKKGKTEDKGRRRRRKKQRPEVKKVHVENKNKGAFLYVTPRSQQVRSFLHFSASFTRVKRREKMRMEEIKWLHRDRLCYRNVSISLSIFIDRLYICMTSQRTPRVINARVAWIIRPGSLSLSHWTYYTSDQWPETRYLCARTLLLAAVNKMMITML